MEFNTGILFVLGSLAIGGSERKSVKIVNELHQRGINIHIAYLNKPDTLLGQIASGIPVICLQREGMYSYKAQSRLSAYIAKNRISHVLTMNLYPLLYASFAKGLNRPGKFKLVAAINTTTLRSLKYVLSMALYAPLLRRANTILFGCEYQRDMWVSQYKISASKSRVIYNGVDENHFSITNISSAMLEKIRSDYGIDSDDIVVGMVGNLRQEKQQGDLIEAAASLIHSGHKLKVLLVGDGPERTRLMNRSKELGMNGSVLFAGEIADIRMPLSLMDIFVLTSVSVETFSNAALEAMSMEIPVVLSDVGGSREMVSDGYNGYVYERGNVGQLTKRLERIIEDSALMYSMGKNARHRIEKEFSLNKMVDQYHELLAG